MENHIGKEISFNDIFGAIWNDKFFIILMTILSIFSFYLYSLSITEKYSVTAKLFQTDNSRAENAIARDTGLLNLLSGGSSSSGRLSFVNEILESKDFFSYLLDTTKIELVLDRKNFKFLPENEEILKASILDNSPRNEPTDPLTFYRLHAIFLDSFKFERLNLVELTVLHENANAAKVLAEVIVEKLNTRLKNLDLVEAQNSVEYLTEATMETQNIAIKQALNNLIESNLHTIVLTNTKQQYALEYLDKPYKSLTPSYPNRRLYIYSGFIVGFFLSILISLIRKYYF